MSLVVMEALGWPVHSMEPYGTIPCPDRPGYVFNMTLPEVALLDSIPLEDLPLVLAQGLPGDWSEGVKTSYLAKRLELGI